MAVGTMATILMAIPLGEVGPDFLMQGKERLYFFLGGEGKVVTLLIQEIMH